MVCHEIRLRGDDSFSYWPKKTKRSYLLFAYVGVEFSGKTMHYRDA